MWRACFIPSVTSRSGLCPSPVNKVDCAVDGVNDPGRCVGQLQPLTRCNRLLPNKAVGARTDNSVTCSTRLLNQESVSDKPVIWVATPDGRNENLLHLLVSFRHQVSGGTLQLDVFLLLKCRQNYLTQRHAHRSRPHQGLCSSPL